MVILLRRCFSSFIIRIQNDMFYILTHIQFFFTEYLQKQKKQKMLIFALLFTVVVCNDERQDYWHRDHRAQCENGQYIRSIISIYNSNHKDRLWNVICDDYITGVSATQNCSWVRWNNRFRLTHYAFRCPRRNGIMTGMASQYDVENGDRLYQFRCCNVPNRRLSRMCRINYANESGERMNVTMDDNQVLTGAFSSYENLEIDSILTA